ncbi:MAG: hypothetical protein JST86_11375 [Bacteroidetes bacterium]|nr:hypothetical protein [Bacteroidota bacterium]
MIDKIKRALLGLLESPAPDTVINMGHENKSGDKSFTARVAYNDSGKPAISLLSFSGYKEHYLLSRFRAVSNELFNSDELDAQSGDIVLTRQLIDNAPASGTVISLSSSVRIYSVNGGILSCNGKELGNSFQARFIKLLNGKCDADAAITTYSQFKLL